MSEQTDTTEITGEWLAVGLGRPDAVGFEAASAMALATQIDNFITDNPKIDIADIHYAMVLLDPGVETWHSALVLFHHKSAESAVPA